jgi:hypothetical protein
MECHFLYSLFGGGLIIQRAFFFYRQGNNISLYYQSKIKQKEVHL